MGFFTPTVVAAAQKHALECYPEESVGAVVKGRYKRLRNAAKPIEQHQPGKEATCDCRLCSFDVDPKEWLKIPKGSVTGIIHSHPGGPASPSAADMSSQYRGRVPWGIIPLDIDRVGDIIEFGDELPAAPLLGRSFVHGVHDCYSLIRDVYRAGREQLLADGIIDGVQTDWPYPPTILADVPRGDGWWEGDEDLYSTLFASRGFEEITIDDAMPGDVFLAKIYPFALAQKLQDAGKELKYNHGGVYLGGNLILDHRPSRISAREPLHIWARTTQRWLRFTCAQSSSTAT